jgi:hypothetical protein
MLKGKRDDQIYTEAWDFLEVHDVEKVIYSLTVREERK